MRELSKKGGGEKKRKEGETERTRHGWYHKSERKEIDNLLEEWGIERGMKNEEDAAVNEEGIMMPQDREGKADDWRR